MYPRKPDNRLNSDKVMKSQDTGALNTKLATCSYQKNYKWYRCWFRSQSHQLCNKNTTNCTVVDIFVNRLRFEKLLRGVDSIVFQCLEFSLKIRLYRFYQNNQDNLMSAD